MRILVLSHMYPNQMNEVYGIFVANQVGELVKLGHEVKVVSPVPWAGGPLPLFNDKWGQYAKIPRQEFRQGVEVYYPRYPVLPGRCLLHWSGFSYYWSIKNVVKEIEESFPFDLIHAHVALPDGFAALRITPKRPVVLTIHGVDIFITVNLGNKCRRAVVSTLNKADKVVAVSSKIKKELERYMLDEKLTVIPNGIIPAQVAEESSKLEMQFAGKTVILTVAYLIERKGHRYVLEALARLVPEFPNLLYLVIGDGVEERSLKKMTEELGLGEHVAFLGRRSSREVMQYMALSDIFVLASWNEAFGVVYLEAMVHGKPVIGCRGEGVEDVVTDGINGLLVPPRDPGELSRTLKSLLSNQETAERLGEEGRKTVLEKFTWAQVVKELQEIYYSLAERF